MLTARGDDSEQCGSPVIWELQLDVGRMGRHSARPMGVVGASHKFEHSLVRLLFLILKVNFPVEFPRNDVNVCYKLGKGDTALT